MDILKSKSFWIKFIVAAVFISMSSAYFILPAKIIEKPQNQIFAKGYFQEKTKHQLNFKNLKASSTFDLCVKIKVENFSINKDKESDFIRANNAGVKIFLPALLFNKVDIKQFTFDKVDLNLVRDTKGKFDIESLIPQKTSKGYKIDLSDLLIDIQNYKANLKDFYVKPSQDMYLQGEKLSIHNNKHKNLLEINTLSNISLNNSKFEKIILNLSIKNLYDRDKINLDARLVTSNIQLKKYLPYAKAICPKITNLDGDISTKGSLSYNPAYSKASSDIEIKTKNLLIEKNLKPLIKIDESTSLKIDSKVSKNEVDINNISIKSNEVDIDINGAIAHRGTPYKNITINSSIKNTSVEKALKIFPDFIKVKNDIVLKLKKYETKGLIDGSFSIQNTPLNLFMTGSIDVKNFALFNDKFLSDGRVYFEDKKMFFDTKINIEEEESFDIKGFVNFLKQKEVDIKVKSTTANIEKTQKILLAIQDIIGFSLGPIPDMKLKGLGDIKIDITGKTSGVNLNGLFNFKESFAKYNTLFFPANDIEGSISFKNKKIIYNDIKGNVKGNNASLNGYHMTTGEYDTIIKVTDCDIKEAKTFIDNSPLLTVLKDSLFLIRDAKGTGSANINLYGTKTVFNSKGFVDIAKADVYFVDYSMPYRNARGIVEFDNLKVNFKDAAGTIASSPATLKGSIDGNIADIELESNNIDSRQALRLINTSKALIETKKVLKDITEVKGKLKGKIFLKGDFIQNPNILDYGIFEAKKNVKTHFKYKNIPAFITIDKGDCRVTQTTFNTGSIDLKKGNSTINVKGSVNTNSDKTLDPNLDVTIRKFELSDISELKSSGLIKKEDKSLMDNLNKIEGTFSGKAKILKNNITSDITLNNVSAVYSPLKLPLKIPQGKLTSANETIKLDNIKLSIGDSLSVIKGEINDFIKSPKVNIICSSNILPADINRYINPNLANPVVLNNELPIDIKYQSNKNRWKLFGLLKLESNNYISYNGAKLGSINPHSIVLDAQGKDDNITIQNAQIITENNPSHTILFIKGNIEKTSSQNPVFKNLYIKSSKYLDISFLNPILAKYSTSKFFSEGKFNTQVVLNGTKNSPKIEGTLNLKNIKAPSVETSINSAKFEFNKDKLVLKESEFSIGRSKLYATGTFDSLFETPVIGKDVVVTSEYINLDEINRIVAKNKSTFNYKNSSIPSVTIQNASLSSKELIIQNLITSNAHANIAYTPDWILTISDFKTDTAGGSINGNITLNTKTTEVNGDVNFNNMLANATSSTFLGVSNEVYGNLNGHSTFSTRGYSEKELIQNLNGNASFTVTDGRLVRLGSTEYLLKAVNVIQGGVTSLNLNNVINLVSPQKTGNFETLTVDFDIKDGIVNTNNLITKGDNLSLYIAGSLDMDTNYSDLTILGRLSRKGSTFLGPLGKVSLNSVINSIPGIGSDSNSYLSSVFPHISNIPGFELNDDNYRRFVVNIEGDLYESSSVKDFRWIK